MPPATGTTTRGSRTKSAIAAALVTTKSQPPIVGVPCLAMWCSWPSRRICLPKRSSRSRSISQGPQSRPTTKQSGTSRSETITLGARLDQLLDQPLQTHPARALDQDQVARSGLVADRQRVVGVVHL